MCDCNQNRKRSIVLWILVAVMSTNIFAQDATTDLDKVYHWHTISFGGLVGYQFQKTSFLELGGIIDYEYKWLLLSGGYSLENDFGRKIHIQKGSFRIGVGSNWFVYPYAGIHYGSAKNSNKELDDFIRTELGIHIPAGFLGRKRKKFQSRFRFNMKISYHYNFFLDQRDISTLGPHGFNISLMIGYGIWIKDRKNG
jgi:hypothetical protein